LANPHTTLKLRMNRSRPCDRPSDRFHRRAHHARQRERASYLFTRADQESWLNACAAVALLIAAQRALGNPGLRWNVRSRMTRLFESADQSAAIPTVTLMRPKIGMRCYLGWPAGCGRAN